MENFNEYILEIEKEIKKVYEKILIILPKNHILDLDKVDCVSVTFPDHAIAGIKNGMIYFIHLEKSTEYFSDPRNVTIDELLWILNTLKTK